MRKKDAAELAGITTTMKATKDGFALILKASI